VSSVSRSSPRIRVSFRLFLPLPHRGWHGSGVFSSLHCSRGFRTHRVGMEEFLEEWYDRSAESCDLFDNISEVDKYTVTCTVCRHFEEADCASDSKGPNILDLLKASYIHDGLAWR
jgi:hypothetical protein